MPSRAVLTSQQFGITNGVVGHFGEASRLRFDGAKNQAGHYMHPEERPLLGGHLGRNGIYTASVSCFAERHLAYWFYGNFRETIRPSTSLGQTEDARDVNAAAFDWLDRHGEQDDWFLHLNYWEPHTQYIEPQEWIDRAAESGPAPQWLDEDSIAEHGNIYGPHTAKDLNYLEGGTTLRAAAFPQSIESRADFERLVNGYDGEICYWDYHFGQLLNKLADLGILEDTAIIVSADHGESLGENGLYAEHGLANEPTHHIPLIVYWPDVTADLPDARRHWDGLIYNLDLGPTLCDLLGMEIPAGWQGESFAPVITGEQIEGRPYLVFGQGAHTYQRAVRTQDYFYIRTLHPGCIKTEPEQLYKVSADPHLTRNILSREAGTAEAMKAHLAEWWHTYAGAPGAQPDPMQAALAVGPSLYAKPEVYARHLEASGRKSDARELRTRLGIAG